MVQNNAYPSLNVLGVHAWLSVQEGKCYEADRELEKLRT